MEYFLSALFTSVSVVALILIYDSFFERKYSVKIFSPIAALFTILIFLFLNLGNEYSAINSFSQTAEVLFFLSICLFLYKGNMIPKLFVSVSSYCIFLALSTISKMLSAAMCHMSITAFMENRFLYTLFLFAANFFNLFLASVFHSVFALFQSKEYSFKNLPFLFLICLFPISTIYTILFFVKESLNTNAPPYSFHAVIPLIAFLASTNLAALVMVSWFQTHLEEHKQLIFLNEQTRAQQESMKALSLSYEKQRKMSHDFNKHMQVLANLLLSNDMESAKQYLAQINEWQTGRILLVETNNSTMNALLNQKAYAAKAQGVDIVFQVNDLSGVAIKAIDYSIVLGNLLDNALEACQALPKEIFKQIVVKVLLEDDALFISVRNSSNPVKICDHSIATTKPDPSLHGFGLPTIKEFLEQNNASYTMHYKNGFFTFALEWPNA